MYFNLFILYNFHQQKEKNELNKYEVNEIKMEKVIDGSN